MYKSRFEEFLSDGCRKMGFEIDNKTKNQFFKYKELLVEWNKKMNLTAIEDEKDIIIKHFLDSISIIPHIPDNCENCADIGTGAGFPGIPVKIMRSDIKVTLIDSLEKRVKFLNKVNEELKLKAIWAIHARAEDLGRDIKHREKYRVCTARAVASLNVLLEYCLPFVEVGGLFIAMKGSSIEEIKTSKNVLRVLGGEIIDIKREILPLSDIKRNVIIIRKFRQIPTSYPRKAGKPSKHPLI